MPGGMSWSPEVARPESGAKIDVMKIRMLLGGMLLAMVPGAGAQEDIEAAMIFFKDGRALAGRVSAVESDRILWSLPGLPQPQGFPYSEVDFVEFPQSIAWREAMALFDEGNYREAVAKFRTISEARDKSSYFPAPGNFSSLARRRLLDCHRRLRQAEEISVLAKTIDWERLPKRERGMAGIIECWAAVGRENWPEARQAFEKARKETAEIDPAAGELAYLNGLILIGEGKPEEASVRFGRAYAADASADAGMAADALKRAIQVVQLDPERIAELRALVRLYAELHGNGELWPEAGEALKRLRAEAEAESATEAP